MREQSVSLPEIPNSGFVRAPLLQFSGQLEVSLSEGNVGGSGPRTGDHLFGRKSELTGCALLDPVTKSCVIILGLSLDMACLTEDLRQSLGKLDIAACHGYPIHRWCRRRLGRPDDHPVLIDPNSIRNLDNSEQLSHQMVRINQGRMNRLGCLDKGSTCLCPY
jgi:hypothetical protein